MNIPAMMLLAMPIGQRHIGFFGQDGPIWVLLGLITCAVVVAILFKILRLALPALGVTEPWVSIIFWICVLVVFLMFINFAFGFGWLS